MHWSKRLITAVFLTVFSIILLFSATFVYLIVSPLGGKILVRYFLQEYASLALMHVGHYQGTLHEGFILKDVRARGLPYLPGALARIQQVRVHLPLWDWQHSDVDILNARIFIPGCDTVVFTGRISGGEIKGNLYAKSVDVHVVARFWANENIKKNLQGFISNIDVVFQGPVLTPVVSGHFLVDGIRYKSVFLTDGVSGLKLILMPADGRLEMEGEVSLDSGSLVVRQVNLKLTKSKVYFYGDVENPRIDIHAASKIEDTDIHLALRGTVVRPQLIVTSNPPLPPQDALHMLFTGNAWSTTSGSPLRGVTNSQLADDLLNYSQTDGNNEQRIGLKTKLTDKLKLGMEMEQVTPTLPGDSTVYSYRKIEGEMDLSDHWSLNISKQVLPQDRDVYVTPPEAQQDAETQIYLEYKKRF